MNTDDMRHCPAPCGSQLDLVGRSADVFGLPPEPMERYYRCSACSAEWLQLFERGLLPVVIRSIPYADVAL